jgi:hypothetical protein
LRNCDRRFELYTTRTQTSLTPWQANTLPNCGVRSQTICNYLKIKVMNFSSVSFHGIYSSNMGNRSSKRGQE